MSLCPSSSSCRWNSMMVSLRRMVQESAWSAVMTVLAQARIEANDTASAPPLVMVKREQVIDILGLLEPFEEALQVKGKVRKNLIMDVVVKILYIELAVLSWVLWITETKQTTKKINPLKLQHKYSVIVTCYYL